jgi:hypothetical protein
MSDIIRSCKSGSEWTENELEAYNIRVINIDNPCDFFGTRIENVNLQDVPNGVLVCEEFDMANDLPTYKFLRYLDLAMRPDEGQESAVDDFAAEILRMMQYESIGHIICLRKDIKLLMCGQETHAKTDVCVLDTNDILLLIQEDKSHINRSNAVPQLVAEAIAAFQHNNLKRFTMLHKEPLDTFTFPCIIMVGTYPVFYKITVTNQLNRAVQSGMYPQNVTIVERFDPLFGMRRRSFGMLPINNRERVLKCFKAFKQFMKPFE